jgi:hypothetical protein
MIEEKVAMGKGEDQGSDQITEGQTILTPEEERKLLRKIDCVILPMVC